MNGASERVTISCVIPTHERPDLLREALASVAKQTIPPLEVIVASDVGDDASRAVADAFGARYLKTPGSGASASRNFGAQHSIGTHIAMLDDDDVWLPSHLERAMSVILQAGEPTSAVTWFDVFDESRRWQGERVPPGLSPRDVLTKNWGTTGSNMVVARLAFEAIEGFDEELVTKNDTDFFYRLLRSGAGYRVANEVTMLQRKHTSGQLTNRSERRATGNAMYLAKHRSELTWSDRRNLRLAIHRIRRSTSPRASQRIGHLILAALNYSPKKFVEEQRIRARLRDPFNLS